MTLPHDLEPILPGFHPDPSICRVEDTYYIATSSFEYRPGVPLFRSTNLLAWEPIGHALSTPDHFPEDSGWPSHGIYAPTLRHHRGIFWLTTTNVTPYGKEQMILHAPAAEGPWSIPVITQGMSGIDPDLSWDGNDCYMTWTTSDPANPAILQVRIDPFTAKALEKPRVIWRGTGLAYPEAPHLYFNKGWWYLLLAEGGTERGHAMTMARSKSIQGPFDGCPHNPIFSHRSLLHTIQNTGHGDMVQSADGSWLIVFLGVRPKGGNPGFHTNGRESFLAAVNWDGDWPKIIAYPEAIAPRHSDFEDDFSAAELHSRWISPGVFPRSGLQDKTGGCLPPPNQHVERPSMLLTRVMDPEWEAEVMIDAPPEGSAFLLRIDDDHWCGLEIGAERVSSVLNLPGLRHQFGWVSRPSGTLRMHMKIDLAGSGIGCPPDYVTLSLHTGETWHHLARIDGRYVSTEVAGGFTGRVWGVASANPNLKINMARYRRKGVGKTWGLCGCSLVGAG